MKTLQHEPEYLLQLQQLNLILEAEAGVFDARRR